MEVELSMEFQESVQPVPWMAVPIERVSIKVVEALRLPTLRVVMVDDAESTKMPALVVVGLMAPDQIHSQAPPPPDPLVPQ